jgi:hypothetical protein
MRDHVTLDRGGPAAGIVRVGNVCFGKSRQRCLNRECLVRSPILADCDITRYKTEALSHSLASFAARLAFTTQSIHDEGGMVRL